MKGRTRFEAIALFLIVFPVLASCQAMTAKPTTTPNVTPGIASKSSADTCTRGAQDETIQQYFGLKMTSATTGWAVAQCSLGAQPTFAGGSTLDCRWPRVESMGILRTADGGRTWTDVSPPSVQNRTWHHGEFFLDPTRAWVAEVSRTASACVSQITTYRTSDGGRTWQQGGAVPVKTEKPTDDIFNVCCSGKYLDFVDPQHGWLLVVSPPNASGTPGIMVTPTTLYSTADGGLHWNLVTTNPGSSALNPIAACRPNSYSLGSMKFTSATTGSLMVGCPAQTLLTTQDGGATWRPQQLPDCGQCYLSQPTFFDSTHAIVTSQQSAVMLATTDGGANWAQYQLPAGASRHFSFTDANHGWLVSIEQLPTSYDTAVYRTTDGGRSWSLLGRPGFATSTSQKNTYYPIYAVQFVDANIGFAALGPLSGPQVSPDNFGPQFQLFGTEDGGRSWKVLTKQVATQPCKAQYVELGNGNYPLTPMKFANATTAWARGALRTTDGGAHWRDVSSAGLREGASTPLYPPGYVDVYLDGDHAWQAGIYGSTTTCSDHITAFATSDGGKTWLQSKPIALDLPSGYRTGTLQMGFPTAQSGWLAVPAGIQTPSSWGPEINVEYLFTTSDGGLTWRRVATIDASVSKGLPLAPNCRQPQLGQITFSSATAGWMAIGCVPSKLLVTKDGGATWTAQSVTLPCECSVQLPTFVDPKHGFMQVYGSGGGKTPSGPSGPTVVSTSDGGATWQALPPLPGSSITMSLTFSDASNLWALVAPPGWTKMSGGKDSLYRSKDGGQSWALVQQGVPIGRAFSGLLFADDKHGMVMQSRNATWSFNTPGFADANDQVLAVTSDGGHTWKLVNPALGT